ncbi:MAG: arginase family protein [Lentimicrobium sp.]|nr:arginase family protein [Lentimicrobium sp.]
MKQKQFGAIPEPFSSVESAKAVIIPVPFEGSNPLFKGSDKGPEAILEASTSIDLYDIHTDSEAWKAGIHTSETIRERNVEKMIKEVQTRVTQLLKKKKFPVILGGEHTVAIGAFRAFADFYRDKDEDLTIVQFDAHAGIKSARGTGNLNHHCVMSHAILVAPVVQVGIRSMSAQEREIMEPGRIFYSDNIQDTGNRTWMYDLLNKLSKNVFITIDLDVLDPSLMPAVATPEPGGMEWQMLMGILEKINEKSALTGVCISGLTPIKYNKAPNFIAARLVSSLITLRFNSGLK